MRTVNQFLWVLPLLAQLAVVGRMLATKSVRRYPFLFFLLLVLFALGLFGNAAFGRVPAPVYSLYWVAAYVTGWSLTALALTEVCTRSLESYKRLGKVGHQIVQAVLATSGLVILSTLFLAPSSWSSRFFEFFQTQGYLAQGSLALLGLSVLTFAWSVGLKLRPNARLVLKTLTVFCAGEAVLDSGISAPWPSYSFYVGVFWATGCWSSLAWRWARQPVEAHTGSRPALGGQAAAAMLAQMKTTNTGLADMVRRR